MAFSNRCPPRRNNAELLTAISGGLFSLDMATSTFSTASQQLRNTTLSPASTAPRTNIHSSLQPPPLEGEEEQTFDISSALSTIRSQLRSMPALFHSRKFLGERLNRDITSSSNHWPLHEAVRSKAEVDQRKANFLTRRACRRARANGVLVVAVKGVVRSHTALVGMIKATVNILKQISSIWIGLFALAREIGSDDIYQYTSQRRPTKARYLVDTKGSTSEVFHLFMKLPAELRQIVYEFATPSQETSLRSTAQHRFDVVVSPAATNLSYVNKFIFGEAEDEVFKRHTFILNVNLGTNENNIINPYQLPRHVEPHIQRLVLVVDCTRVPNVPHLHQSDWRFLQRMIGLKSLRICMLHLRTATPRLVQDRPRICNRVVQDIMVRVPGTCDIVFGTGSQTITDHIKDMKAKTAEHLEAEPVSWVPRNRARVTTVPRAHLRAAHAEFSRDFSVRKGVLQGRSEDLRPSSRHDRAWAELSFAEGA